MVCMLGKATWEYFPKARQVKVKPLHQINVHSFSSSVPSIEGYNHAVVFETYRIQMDMRNDDQGSNDSCCKEVVQRHCRF